MVGSIVVVGVLTRRALLHTVCDLKAAQMNVQHNLIRKLMTYKFELGHDIEEASKNIRCAEGESAVDNSTATRPQKKFLLLPGKVI